MPQASEVKGRKTNEAEKRFSSSLDHLLAELERIDLLLQGQVRRARELRAGDDEFPGLCISEQEVDTLLARPCGLPPWASQLFPEDASTGPRLAQLLAAIEQTKQAAQADGIELRLEKLASRFGLERLEVDIVLLCLAPEMDLRYEKLYAYLQDDVTKKRASMDLALNILCPDFAEKIAARSRFAVDAPLVAHEIIQLFVDPSQPEPTFLRKYCKLDARIVDYLLGRDEIDSRLKTAATLRRPATGLGPVLLPGRIKERLLALARGAEDDPRALIFALQGIHGADQLTAAEGVCGELGMTLLRVDGKRLAEPAGPGSDTGVRLALRELRLQPRTAVFWHGFSPVPGDGRTPLLDDLFHQIARAGSLHFLDFEAAWEPADGQIEGGRFIRVELPALGRAERLQVWKRVLPPAHRADDADLTAVSERFKLGAAGIEAAAASAMNLARWRDPTHGAVTTDDLCAACRLHSNRKLAEVARHVRPRYRLADIVLPPSQTAQLHEAILQATHRHIVFGDWGFERKLSLGKGLNALFSGPPGTGKTMAAEVIAGELGLDLYKIDLAQIVNKYIGETEKNLDRVFREAQGSNAVLMFDEADALFGKRSEVRDAHDRYANIEVGYLLQKMEEYEGIAILATNLRQNMDEAFLRRMHVIIEFPFPDEEHRREIWRRVFPREAPVGDDVDLGRLARDVRLSGGNINNIALAAAFSAAGNGGTIRMSHLLRAASREHQKLGRTWAEGERVPPSAPQN